MSRQLLIQAAGTPGLDRFLIDELSRSCSSQLDFVCLYGNPALNADQPRGLKFTPGIHTRDIGNTTAVWEDLCELEAAVENERISLDTYAHITSPDVRATLRKMNLWAAGSDRSVWEAITRAFSSTVVNTDEILFGAFGFMTIGIGGSAADVLVNPFTQAGLGQVDIVVNLFCSVAIRLVRAFGVASITVPPRTGGPPPPLRQIGAAPEFPPPPAPAQPPIPSPGPESDEGETQTRTTPGSGSGPRLGKMKVSHLFK